jgi:hypothetical protein
MPMECRSWTLRSSFQQMLRRTAAASLTTSWSMRLRRSRTSLTQARAA